MANKEKSGFSKMIQSKAFKGVSIAVASALIGAGVTYLATNNNSETKALVTIHHTVHHSQALFKQQD